MTVYGGISVGYDRPLVAALTPWQKARISLPDKRGDWPPLVDFERLQAYDQFLALIENRPYDVFDSLNLPADTKNRIMLAVGLPELLCNVWADAVWADGPKIEFSSSKLDDAWKTIDSANGWTEAGAWESVFAAAAFGHSVLRLYRDEAREETHGSSVVIEEIDPAIYFPVVKRGTARQIESVTLAWEEDRSAPDDEKEDRWQVREFHTLDGDGGSYRIVRQERSAKQGFLGRDNVFREVFTDKVTDVKFLPFIDMHAKRWRGRFWGVSELDRSYSLFDEIDSSLSNIAEVLDYHGNPLLQVPASWIYGGTFSKGVNKAYGVRRPEDKDLARYITYDGQLDAALAELDKVLDFILLTAEIPLNYFGRGEAAATQSGTSMKLQLQNYVKKAGRWQAAERMRYRDLSTMALRLDGQTVEITKPGKVTDGSPLPVDDEQEATIETALYTAGLSSRKTSITKLRRVDDVDEEIAAIEDEEESKKPDLPPPLPPGQIPGQPGVVDPNADTGAEPPR